MMIRLQNYPRVRLAVAGRHVASTSRREQRRATLVFWFLQPRNRLKCGGGGIIGLRQFRSRFRV